MTGLPHFTVPLSAAAKKTVALRNVYLSTEPEIPVVVDPLARGYALILAGNEREGCETIVRFLEDVFPTRKGESSTRQMIGEVCAENGWPKPIANERVDPRIVRAAAARRIEKLHLPLLRSIQKEGYAPTAAYPVTMRKFGDKYLVVDGKNRCSILAAMGEINVPNVEVRE